MKAGARRNRRPSKTKPQRTALVKWKMYSQSGKAVYTFTPTGFVPSRHA